MDLLKHIIGIMLPSILLTGCYADFEPNIPSTPVLCVNADIVAGSPVKVVVSRTYRYDEGSPIDGLDIYVDDATVTMQVNDDPEQTLHSVITDNGLPDYFPDYKKFKAFMPENYTPRPGDRIKIRASSPTYGDAWGEVTVPQPVRIDRVETTLKNVERWGSVDYLCDMDVRLYFTDLAAQTDYYKFDLKTFGNTKSYVSSGYFDESIEPLFTEHVGTLESAVTETSGYTIFSDRQISGKTYPLHIRIDDITFHHNVDNSQSSDDTGGFKLTLNTISQSYYRHVLSVWEANDGIVGSLGGIGLGEVVTPNSNVSTGAGVISARTPSTVTIALWPLIEKELAAGARAEH